MVFRQFLSRHEGSATQTTDPVADARDIIKVGGLEFTEERGGNDSKPSYQEASGAPVEKESPLGYQVSWITIILLNVGQMVGTGVFSTPGSIFRGVGSVGLSLLYWVLGLLIAGSGLSVYLELASYFPNRSGAEVVYLEQAWPRPKYFFPTAFAVLNVLLAFSSSNAVVLSDYLYRTAGKTPTEWQSKGVAIAGYTVAVVLCLVSNKYSLWFSNGIGVVKLLTLVFISITGWVVLAGGASSVPDPGVNFRNAFDGTSSDVYGITNALVRINFAYSGYANGFNLVAEIKNPIRTLKVASPIALLIVGILYMLANVAYFAAVPKADINLAKQIVASLFFERVFGVGRAARGLNVLIALSAFGNLVSVLIGSSRIIRECGRQGVLPYPAFWASTKPFGTPLGPYLLKYVLTILMIVAPPFGDAFNFAVDLKSYPDALFFFAMAIGIYSIRRQRARINAPRPDFKAWDVAVIFWVLVQVYLLVMPWVPPKNGIYAGNVSFFYATASLTGIGILITCGIYYHLWIKVIPRYRGYRIRQELLVLEGGEATHKLVNVPLSQLDDWDSKHGVTGELLSSSSAIEQSKDNSSVSYASIRVGKSAG